MPSPAENPDNKKINKMSVAITQLKRAKGKKDAQRYAKRASLKAFASPQESERSCENMPKIVKIERIKKKGSKNSRNLIKI